MDVICKMKTNTMAMTRARMMTTRAEKNAEEGSMPEEMQLRS
jgi:hypothetical protein